MKTTDLLVLRQVPNDGCKSLALGSPDDVFPVGASCARDLLTRFQGLPYLENDNFIYV